MSAIHPSTWFSSMLAQYFLSSGSISPHSPLFLDTAAAQTDEEAEKDLLLRPQGRDTEAIPAAPLLRGLRKPPQGPDAARPAAAAKGP